MKNLFFIVFLFKLSLSYSQTQIPTVVTLTNDIYHNEDEVFYSHQGPGEFDNTLAMSIEYTQILNLRNQVSRVIGRPLNFFTGWNIHGEAHITVVTPVEFDQVLKKVNITMNEIEAIAKRYEIQQSRLNILGIGSAKRTINNEEHETFFIIVDSENLRLIRQQVFYLFVKRGGDRSLFDPTWFFPHITLGFTKDRDLHESHGVYKNLKFSFDPRFDLKFLPMND